jgi:hypothetical protein
MCSFVWPGWTVFSNSNTEPVRACALIPCVRINLIVIRTAPAPVRESDPPRETPEHVGGDSIKIFFHSW